MTRSIMSCASAKSGWTDRWRLRRARCPRRWLRTAMDAAFICPEACGSEAAWAGGEVIAAPSLLSLVNHFRGGASIKAAGARRSSSPAEACLICATCVARNKPSARSRSQRLARTTFSSSARQALANRCWRSVCRVCCRRFPPKNCSKFRCCIRWPDCLSAAVLTRTRPFRAPHHSASMAALVGGGLRAKPGEISLAHQGVLFLDELPEFSQQALDALRQPLESGQVLIARANHHVTYPARILLAAAMNPCRCGGGSGAGVCRRGPRCAVEYQARLSGAAPLLDRID
jgi:magnesium chelatase family protein